MPTNPFRKPENPDLDEAIASGFTDLRGFTLETDEAARTIDQLSKLHDLKRKRVSPDTWVIASFNAGIAFGLFAFEKHNVITTRAMTFLTKFR